MRSGIVGQKAMLGNAAIDLLSKPMAQITQAWAVKKVDDGAHEVQIGRASCRERVSYHV